MSDITERLSALRELLTMVEWDERALGPGLAHNEYADKPPSDSVQAIQVSTRRNAAPFSILKWRAYIDGFQAFDDDPNVAVAKLEQLVHTAIRKDADERVAKARIRYEHAQDVLKRLNETGR